MALIEFNTEQIEQLASTTLRNQQQWDDIWNGVRNRISANVSSDLDALTGLSLQERSQNYAAKTIQYVQMLQARAGATSRIGFIAAQTNAQMAKVIGGG
ncbi:MAG: hypothetical protein ABI137_12165 [Antricoccus sp.]